MSRVLLRQSSAGAHGESGRSSTLRCAARTARIDAIWSFAFCFSAVSRTGSASQTTLLPSWAIDGETSKQRRSRGKKCWSVNRRLLDLILEIKKIHRSLVVPMRRLASVFVFCASLIGLASISRGIKVGPSSVFGKWRCLQLSRQWENVPERLFGFDALIGLSGLD